MTEIKNLYTPDYRGLLTTPEYRQFGVLWEPPEDDYLKKDKEVLPTNDALPPDHLTAIYWG